MNSKHNYKRSLLSAAIVSALSAKAYAVPQYSVTDLGALGGNYTRGLSVNDTGETTGLGLNLDNVNSQTLFATPSVPSQAIGAVLGGGYNEGYDINGVHQITGLGYLPGNAAYHAFFYDGATATDLGTLDALTATGNSLGHAINSQSQVAGSSTVNGGTATHAVVWTKGSASWAIEDLGTLDTAAGTGQSAASDINDLGKVSGFSSVPGSKAQHAVLWTKGLASWSSQDLGTLGGSQSAANAINTKGQVVGYSTVSGEMSQHAVFWDTSVTPISKLDLNTLGGRFASALDIDTAGDVVGVSTTGSDASQVAFIWRFTGGTSGSIVDLNTLIDPASGWTLLEARSISPNGTYITGIGTFNGQKRAFLLTAADTTPPVVSYTFLPSTPNGLLGWYTTPVSVTWTATDKESPISTAACGTVTVNNTAGTSPSCTATSTGGTTTVTTTQVFKVDTTAPSFTGTPAAFTQQASSPAGAIVAYVAPTAADALSGPAAPAVTCAPAAGSLFPFGVTNVTCTAKDTAGNTGTSSFAVTVADLTPPKVSASLTGTAGLNGWFVSPVTVNWTVVDNESTASTCPPQVVATNGTGQALSCSSTSLGGTTTASSPTFNIDTQAPSFVSCPAAVTLTQGLALAQPSATDNLTVPVVTGAPASLPLGTSVVNWKATDQAGLSASCAQSVTVIPAPTPTPVVTPTPTPTPVVTPTPTPTPVVTPTPTPVVTPTPTPVPTTTDLQVNGSASNGGPALNTSFSYSFQVKNGGKQTGQQVSFTDVLPAGLNFGGVRTSAGTCTAPVSGTAGGTVNCNLGDIPAGQGATVTLTVTPTIRGTINNTGSITTSSIDSNTGNNTSLVGVSVR